MSRGSVNNCALMNHSSEGSRRTQRDRVLARLVQARGERVAAPERAEGVLQFSARLHSPRYDLGLCIENRTERVNSRKRSWYRLKPGPSPRKPLPAEPTEP